MPSKKTKSKPSHDPHVVDRSQEQVVLRSCSICNWTNVSLINLGEPNKPRMVCQGCCKRAVDTMDEILALTQNPSHHDGAASAPSVDGVVGHLNK